MDQLFRNGPGSVNKKQCLDARIGLFLVSENANIHSGFESLILDDFDMKTTKLMYYIKGNEI